jgi:cell division protein FtsL
MANNNETKSTDWGKLFIIAIIIIAIFSIYNNWKNKMVDDVMKDTEYRKDMNIENREDAEQNVDDYLSSPN